MDSKPFKSVSERGPKGSAEFDGSSLPPAPPHTAATRLYPIRIFLFPLTQLRAHYSRHLGTLARARSRNTGGAGIDALAKCLVFIDAGDVDEHGLVAARELSHQIKAAGESCITKSTLVVTDIRHIATKITP